MRFLKPHLLQQILTLFALTWCLYMTPQHCALRLCLRIVPLYDALTWYPNVVPLDMPRHGALHLGVRVL